MSEKILRYAQILDDNGAWMEECPDGEYVSFDDHAAQIATKDAEIERYKGLCATLYQFFGAHAIEDDALEPWLDALSAATKGNPPSEEESLRLLPYTLPQDRHRTDHDTKSCRCYGCVLDRDADRAVEVKIREEWREACLAEQRKVTQLIADKVILEAQVKAMGAAVSLMEWSGGKPLSGDAVPRADNAIRNMERILAARANQTGKVKGKEKV